MNESLKCLIKQNKKLIGTCKTEDAYAEWIDRRGPGKFFNINIYALGIMVENKNFRDILAKGAHVGVDGVGASIVVWSQLKQWHRPLGYKLWAPRYIKLLRNERVLVLGGTPKEVGAAVDMMQSMLAPTNEVRGCDGYKDPGVYEMIVDEYRPTICFVGLGMGKQEYLVHRLFKRHEECKYFTCGGWIKQVGGQETNCPNIVSKIGAEWLWRSVFNKNRKHFVARVWLPLRKILSK